MKPSFLLILVLLHELTFFTFTSSVPGFHGHTTWFWIIRIAFPLLSTFVDNLYCFPRWLQRLPAFNVATVSSILSNHTGLRNPVHVMILAPGFCLDVCLYIGFHRYFGCFAVCVLIVFFDIICDLLIHYPKLKLNWKKLKDCQHFALFDSRIRLTNVFPICPVEGGSPSFNPFWPEEDTRWLFAVKKVLLEQHETRVYFFSCSRFLGIHSLFHIQPPMANPPTCQQWKQYMMLPMNFQGFGRLMVMALETVTEKTGTAELRCQHFNTGILQVPDEDGNCRWGQIAMRRWKGIAMNDGYYAVSTKTRRMWSTEHHIVVHKYQINLTGKPWNNLYTAHMTIPNSEFPNGVNNCGTCGSLIIFYVSPADLRNFPHTPCIIYDTSKELWISGNWTVGEFSMKQSWDLEQQLATLVQQGEIFPVNWGQDFEARRELLFVTERRHVELMTCWNRDRCRKYIYQLRDPAKNLELGSVQTDCQSFAKLSRKCCFRDGKYECSSSVH